MAASLRNLFRAWGHPLDIYADHAFRGRPPCARTAGRRIPQRAGGHHAPSLRHRLRRGRSFPRGARRRVLVCNITPADYFQGYDDAIRRSWRRRAQLPALAQCAAAVWTVSRSMPPDWRRRKDISQARVLPLLFDPAYPLGDRQSR